MPKIKRKRLEQIVNNIFGWASQHEDSFIRTLVEASDMTLEEAKHFEVEDYHKNH